MKQVVTIGHLYPKQMNVYGDMGNVISLRYRLQARGYEVRYVAIDSLSALPSKLDILVGGGGQDSNQGLVQADLQKYKNELKIRCDDGLVCLMICGMYQLFGNKFVTSNGKEIIGAGILDLETRAGESRLIGNVVINSKWGKLVGFENHSGKTYLGSGVEPLGTVVKGAGNNGLSGDEGAIFNNIFATYMHGPVLAKNPALADELIKRALSLKGVNSELAVLDDSIEHAAARVTMKRPR